MVNIHSVYTDGDRISRGKDHLPRVLRDTVAGARFRGFDLALLMRDKGRAVLHFERSTDRHKFPLSYTVSFRAERSQED